MSGPRPTTLLLFDTVQLIVYNLVENTIGQILPVCRFSPGWAFTLFRATALYNPRDNCGPRAGSLAMGDCQRLLVELRDVDGCLYGVPGGQVCVICGD